MLLTSKTPKLMMDNSLNPLAQAFEDDENTTTLAEQMINKLQFIDSMHGEVIKNVSHAQIKQKWAQASCKGKQMFLGFKEGKIYVKMKKLRKNKSLASSQEGPFLIVRYLDGNGFVEQDEGKRIHVNKGKNDQLWDKTHKDL